jgi:hypothetical protein
MVVRGRNVLSMTAADSGPFIITLHLARRRTLDQVKALMAPPEDLDAAVARVRCQVGGGDGDGGSGVPRCRLSAGGAPVLAALQLHEMRPEHARLPAFLPFQGWLPEQPPSRTQVAASCSRRTHVFISRSLRRGWSQTTTSCW